MAKTKKKPEALPARQLKAEADMPETVTITLTKLGSKYFALRQHIGEGEIEGNEVEVAYNIASGGYIIVIGKVYYEANLRAAVASVFEQISVEGSASNG